MTHYLLDTNVISETAKTRPNMYFMKWFDAQFMEKLYISSIVVGELYKGVELQKDAVAQRRIRRKTDEIIEAFGERVLPVDQEIAKLWAILIAKSQKKGHPALIIDCYLAAQAICYDMTFVTRNSKDFEQFKDLKILNPWKS